MQQYRPGYPPQGPGRSPHASSRRGPGPMLGGPPPTQMNSAQMHAQHQQAQQERDLARRRASRPTDKSMPEGVDDLVIGNGVKDYKRLADLERRLDATMMRKRLDIMDSVKGRTQIYKTMRIWVTNTCDNQPWQQGALEANTFDFNIGQDGTCRVKIEGRMIDDGDEDPSDDEKDKADEIMQDGETDPRAIKFESKRAVLSQYFKRIVVNFEQARSGVERPPIEWKKPVPNTADPKAAFDTLVFERKADENMNCTISLYRDETPERFKLSKELAAVLDSDEEDRASIVLALWEYVKFFNLQEDEEKRGVRCDDALRAVFKEEKIFFPAIPERLAPHLAPIEPLTLSYTIRIDQAFQEDPTPTVYDVQVPIEDPVKTLMNKYLNNPDHPATLVKMASLDAQIAHNVQGIAQSKARHDFFKGMANDPANFVKRWVASQKRDLEVILGDSGRGIEDAGLGEVWRRGGKGGAWGTEEAREAAAYYLQRQDELRAKEKRG